jgi:M6 family metalloprotease-like protein
MKKNLWLKIIIYIFLLVICLYSQPKTEGWQCGNATHFTNQISKKPIAPLNNDTIKVGLLLVQFADWNSNYDSRGGVGWSDSLFSRAKVDTFKYKFDDYWNIFFSKNTYMDLDPNKPQKHPDAKSHGVAVYGSFTDYWWEVSHGKLYTKAAETHPKNSSIYRSGIINNVNKDGTVNWITLDSVKHAYLDSSTTINIRLMDTLIANSLSKAHELYLLGGIDVDVLDNNCFDKIIIQYAGKDISGFAKVNELGGKYSISNERWKQKNKTERLSAFGIEAHEFGHLLGFYDLYGYGFGNYGVGYFSLMGLGPLGSLGKVSPAHLDPWHKLQIGWLDYEIIENDITNIFLFPVEDMQRIHVPKVYILKGTGDPGNGRWDEKNMDYFILENRSILGFDRYLKWQSEYKEFKGGLVIWHCAGTYPFSPFPGGLLSNGLNLQIVEADNDFAISLGNNWGNPNDFFPGPTPQFVSSVSDTTLPNLRLHNNKNSHNGIYGIHYLENNSILIDSISTQDNIALITENTTWRNIVNLKNDIFITNNATLNIEPGTVINIDPKHGEILRIIFKTGTQLNANGTKNEQIIFSSKNDSSNSDWQGITMESGSHLNVSWTTIKNAIIGINAAQLDLTNQKFVGLVFDFCKIGFKFGGNYLNFEKCIFKIADIVVGIPSRFLDCTFDSCNIEITNYVISNIFYNCTFINESVITFGINTFANIIKNSFLNNSKVVITESSPVFKNNIFLGDNYSKIAINIKSIEGNAQPLIENNTIMYYDFAVKVQDVMEKPNPTVKNNIFYRNNNSTNLSGIIEYNNFFNINNIGAPIGINGNISINPQFVNVTNGDYNLDFHSPCIDKGDPNSDFSNEPFPNGNRINLGYLGNTPNATETFNIITGGTINDNTTWEGTVLVNEDILFTQSSTLNITGGTYIAIRKDKTVSLNCSLNTTVLNDSIIFNVYGKVGKWNGIIISNNLTLVEFSFVKVLNAKTGIFAIRTKINLKNCIFENNITGMIGLISSGIIENCKFIQNEEEGAYFSDSDFLIRKCLFEKNGICGVYVQYGSRMAFISNRFNYNSSLVNTDNILKGGLILYESSPILIGNNFNMNNYNGLFTISMSDPIMNINQTGNNVFTNNGNGIDEKQFAEIFCMDYSISEMDYGHNDIIDDRGGWLLFSNEISYDRAKNRGNFWGSVDYDNIAHRISNCFDYYPFDKIENSHDMLNFFDDEIYNSPIELKNYLHKRLSISTYDSIIENSNYEKKIIQSLEMKYCYYLQNEINLNELYEYLSNLNFNYKFEKAKAKAYNLSNRCLVKLLHFEKAFTKYDSLISNSVIYSNKIYYKLDKSWAEFIYILTPTNHINTINKIKQQIIHFNEYRNNTIDLFSERLQNESQENQKILSDFILFQNYPNPFNPSTKIKYSLPKPEKVKIEIFNLLGQKIETLLNKPMPAGSFEVEFTANDLPSGVYLYRIVVDSYGEAGEFQEVKKMILLK